jgi:hypothetical protein
MSSLARKFGLVIAAALALALVPGLSFSGKCWGQQSNPPAKGATGKTGATGSTGHSAADVLKKAEQMRTEGGRHAAALEAQQAEEAKAKEAAAKSGQAVKTAPKTSGFIVEKGDPFAIPLKPGPSASTPTKDLPPGQAGLMVSQAELQGIVKMQGGNRAIVHGPHDRTYFLKLNDKIYNARVTQITGDSIVFEETSVDPLGNVSKHEITKSLPSEKKP